LSKKYFSTVEIIVANNENIKKKGLGVGFIIKIPVSKTGKDIETGTVAELDKKINEFKAPVRTLNESDIIHKVQPNETITELAKKYGVSAYDIRSNNENIMDKGLQVGQDIRIPKAATAIIAENDNVTPVKPIKIDDDAPIDKASNSEVYVVGDIITTVQPNESLEDIAKKYDVTVDEIIQNNRLLLKDGKVKVGQAIRVPAPKGALEFSPETFD
jgi:LysM repeat protein